MALKNTAVNKEKSDKLLSPLNELLLEALENRVSKFCTPIPHFAIPNFYQLGYFLAA